MRINSIFEFSKFKTSNFQKLIQLDKLFSLLILITFFNEINEIAVTVTN